MSVNDFKEDSRVWFSYPDVHEHARNLFESMQETTPGDAVIIAVGRGGWIPARLVAASFEKEKIPVSCYSVSASYVDLGSRSEHVTITQGLDTFACRAIVSALSKHSNLWVIDGPYLTGTSVAAVNEYLPTVLDPTGDANLKPRIGVLEWIRFAQCAEATWRQPAVQAPDAFGFAIDVDNKPYIEYPWEYSTFDSFPGNA